MNIIHFSDTYYPLINGVTMTVEQFAKKAAADGHKVLLFVPSYSLFSSIQEEENLTIIKVRSIPFPIYPGVQAALPEIVRIFRRVKAFKPEVIHIHTPFVLGVLGILLAQILGTKLVSTYHTLFSQGDIYLSPKRLIPGAKISHSATRTTILTTMIWKLQVIFFNLSDLLIAPTKIIEETLKKQKIKTTIITLPSGIEISKFPMKEDFITTKKILHLGRLGYEKAIDPVIRSFALVARVVPDAHLLIAGDGPAKKSLQQLTKSLGLSKNVTFLGKIEPHKVPDVYRSCDIFITASPFETQGMVLIEAMLSGLPVVAAAVNAPVNLIEQGKNGYLFKEDNERECADYVVSLLQNPTEIKKMGTFARKYAEQFDSVHVSRDLVKAYTNI